MLAHRNIWEFTFTKSPDLALPKVNTNFLKRSFKYRSSMLWSFPSELKKATYHSTNLGIELLLYLQRTQTDSIYKLISSSLILLLFFYSCQIGYSKCTSLLEINFVNIVVSGQRIKIKTNKDNVCNKICFRKKRKFVLDFMNKCLVNLIGQPHPSLACA